LWQAQTPQLFRYEVLRRAFALDGALDATDEAQAVGAPRDDGACSLPWLVMGSTLNIKITYPGDLALAAAILAAEGASR
jgi:2-C-methyl-D-erythritol 4-phosphate cytidylyltransferase